MKVRYGIIGIKGKAGKDHCKLLKQNADVELTAVADVDKTAVEETVREPGVRGFTDYRKLLGAGIRPSRCRSAVMNTMNCLTIL